jgi:hypothetical protein
MLRNGKGSLEMFHDDHSTKFRSDSEIFALQSRT